ncbi:MAG: DNA mismatch repair protein MutS [Rhizobiaceae bacterium]|nr:DNA mismatch repair protein MutS [Rhizobiaceae bacterium]
MMQQYAEIKSVNQDSLLFYRMGDFYELFFDDAETASRALGITLTKRGKHLGEDIPMCGVPVHAAEDYLQRLIALGYRVAVCEQTEDPAEAKKRGSKAVVRRDVVRLVTPGTITEEKLLDPASSNFLVTLVRIRRGESESDLALSWIDISTGSFSVCSTSLMELGATLARLEPRELVLSDTLYHEEEIRSRIHLDDRAITIEANSFFDSQLAQERLTETYGVASLDGFDSFSRAEISAAGAALAYVEKTQIGERPALMRLMREDSGATLFIDAATRANLELSRTLSGEVKGSLLNAMNRTLTGPGARLLAERMMSPLKDVDEIKNRQDSVEFLLSQASLADQVRENLKQAPDMARAVSRLSLNRGGPRDLAAVRSSITVSRQVHELLQGQNVPTEIASALNDLAGIPKQLDDLLASGLADELPLLARDGGFVREGYHSELDELRSLRDESRRIIASMQADYSRQTGVKNLKIKHNNVLGYFIEVTANNADQLTSDDAKATFIHRQTLANAMRFTTTELADIESKIANAAGQALQIELGIFDQLVASVLQQSEVLNNAASALSVLDVSQSQAKLAESLNYVRPKVDGSLAFNVEGGRHPVVEQVLRSEAADPFVANDCDLTGEDVGQLWLLTGPNMGGKSTFLRQNALIVIMAQMGGFVPASKAHIGIVDRLFSRVGAADDLARGRSTFMVEMVETAAILNQAAERSFVILDEIGRGTATFDGLSIAWAAIEYLHKANRCRTLFATHYHELTALAEPLDRLSNVTMKVREWEGEVIFLHEVVSGTADRSYGIQVAGLAGLPEAVVSRAKDVLAQLESGERSGAIHTLIDDLPLFSVEPQPPKNTEKNLESELVSALEEISPDDLSPREALQALYDLRAQILGKKT